jgi:hypothetical protein
VIERHQDYQLSFPTVPVGGLFNVPLQLDSDAPFALRLVKTRNLGSSGFRFKNPREQYQSPEFRTDAISQGGAGLFGPNQGVIIYPQYTYPANGSIIVDVGNATGAPLTNVRVLFRGSKLYRDGAFVSPSYPARCSTLPFTYQVPVLNIPVTGNSQAVPGLNTAGVLNNILNVKSDSDFALRYLCADPWAPQADGQATPFPQSFTEVYVMLRDESRKPYSNEPIHIDDLFTEGSPISVDPDGNPNNFPNIFLPGLLRPEIYLLKEQALYFDVYRDDSALVNQFPVNIFFRFQGAKVFER